MMRLSISIACHKFLRVATRENAYLLIKILTFEKVSCIFLNEKLLRLKEKKRMYKNIEIYS